jgi:c-di-GMP-binding flagellar brake protein YcgR
LQLQAIMAMESAEKAEAYATGLVDRRTDPRFSVDTGLDGRRADPRFGVDGAAYLLLIRSDSNLFCHLVNLSLNGCCVRAEERLTAASMTRVEITFKVRGFPFRICGIIQWADGQHLAGIHFLNMPARRREELAEALDEVKAEIAAKAAKLEAEKRAATELAARQQALEEKAAPAAQGKQAAPAATPAQAAKAPARAKPSGRERREVHREAVDTSAIILLINIAARLTGRILDLSAGGCRIHTDEHFPVGIYTRVEIEFRLDGLPFRLGGVIQAIHDRNTVGIRFLDMSSRKREQVEQLITEIEEMRAREQGLGDRD